MSGKRRKKQDRQIVKAQQQSMKLPQPPASNPKSPPVELYATIIVAIVSAVMPMNDLLRCLFILLATGLAVDLCWRSPRMAARKTWIKTALTIVAIVVVTCIDYRIADKPRTYIYLLPTQEMTSDVVRMFFIRQSGPDVLHHVRLSLTEIGGKSVQKAFDEVDPPVGEPYNDGFDYGYISLEVTHAWSEQYELRVTSREMTERQMIGLYGTKHTGFRMSHNIELSSRSLFGAGGTLRLLDFCEDADVPKELSNEVKAKRSCDGHAAVNIAAMTSHMDDVPNAIILPSGDLVLWAPPKPVIPLGAPESESDVRHITEWQQSQVLPSIRHFLGSRILIFYCGGDLTHSYADDFAKMFRRAGWSVDGPKPPLSTLK
jgi:hypothetical protein